MSGCRSLRCLACLLILAGTLASAETPRIALSAQDADHEAAQGLLALQAAGEEPRRTVTAALAFTSALTYFKAQGTADRVHELQASLYWCSKRLTLDDINVYLSAANHEPGLAKLAEQMAAASEVVVPKEEATAYFGSVEKYAQQHPADFLQISMRYYEVADRFQGTAVSLVAQRRSLDAQRQSTLGTGVESLVARQLPAAIAIAGDFPEGAAKILADFNNACAGIAKNAAIEVAKEERRLTDALAKDAESQQRLGNLDGMIASQRQMANPDSDETGLSKAGQSAADSFKGACGRVIARALESVAKEQAKMIRLLQSAQTDEAKKGNLSGALAIRGKRDELVAAAEAKRLAPIIGKWSVTKPMWSAIITLGKDGTAVSPGGDVGTWSFHDNVIKIAWTSEVGGWEEIHLDGTPGDSWTGKANVVAQRLPDPEQPYVGRYVKADGTVTIILRKDMTFASTHMNLSGSYKVDGKRITMTGGLLPLNFTVKDENSLIDEGGSVFIRK